ncbi:unnamed protein product [Cylicostephanus goldi]|uniref:Uncharacterized protein n=1 Tax=Cylicostephanus goldi TaxID=71465 RepID=A0A3P6SWZ2_CYLGO|nr:unnamed protein product [Cylicostephanus goldi]
MDVERTQSSQKVIKGTKQLLSMLPTIKLLVMNNQIFKLKPDAKTPKTEKKATAKGPNKGGVEKRSIKTCVPQQVKAASTKEKRKSSKAEALSQAEKKVNLDILNMLRRRKEKIRKAKSMSMTITNTNTNDGTTAIETSTSKESTESTMKPPAHSLGTKDDKEELKVRLQFIFCVQSVLAFTASTM